MAKTPAKTEKPVDDDDITPASMPAPKVAPAPVAPAPPAPSQLDVLKAAVKALLANTPRDLGTVQWSHGEYTKHRAARAQVEQLLP